MILFDRKKALNQIMGPSPDKKQEEEMDHSHVLAKEAIEAVHAHDHEGFANATKALFMHFDQDPDQDGDSHEDVTGKAIE